MAICESAATLPWPGKCFPTAAIPASFMPMMNCCANALTSSGTALKLRLPITSLIPFTSKTGAKLKSISHANSSTAIKNPHSFAHCLANVKSPLAAGKISPMAGIKLKPSRKR